MVTLQRAIEYLYPAAVPIVHYTVRAHNGVEELVQWDAAALGPQPSPAQLAATMASAAFLDWIAALPRQRRKDLAAAAIDSRDEIITLLVAAVQELLLSEQQVRTRFNNLRTALIGLGLNVGVQPLPTLDWPTFKQNILTRARTNSDEE